MDKATWIGVVLGLIAIVLGMFFKGVGLGVLLNPAAILIIVIGTAASVITAFPTSEIKRIPKIVGVLFKEKTEMNPAELIRLFSDWAQLARKEGLLSLEARIDEVEDQFLKNGLSLAVDGQSADYIRDVLNEEIDAMEERHQSGAQIFSQAGTYAPTLGVLGAVIGLIAALGNMNDTDLLGEAISAAFVATMMGIFTGYVLWHPFANKLKRKSKIEAKQKQIMIEGILSILEGEAPRVIEQKLASYLPGSERTLFLKESSVNSNE
ncbi:flagellar motor stator protein MotA [Cytobacillus purgationiresistens]|uniref:Chemotaxis protein MotA n=1 Tax=Cytobacillus purgationiresistens TaxID=863449 RepID=A0ABU0AJW1_9BACI|nr:flagellar motor stator protein MotA [Cytobacillus purgationiresistens]MDQ0271543.1 chemotaxis protein MotA [Cytobacillus purgationiresistens]